MSVDFDDLKTSGAMAEMSVGNFNRACPESKMETGSLWKCARTFPQQFRSTHRLNAADVSLKQSRATKCHPYAVTSYKGRALVTVSFATGPLPGSWERGTHQRIIQEGANGVSPGRKRTPTMKNRLRRHCDRACLEGRLPRRHGP